MIDFPVGQGDGKTARELGISQVAHGTGAKGLRAYEAIIGYSHGVPNLVAANNNELNIPGGGFYTAIGDMGSTRATNYTVRLTPLPEARDGTDFIYLDRQQWVVIKNPAAFRVANKKISLTPMEYFRMYAEGRDFHYSYQGELNLYERKLVRDSLVFEPEIASALVAEVHNGLLDSALPIDKKYLIFRKWLQLPLSVQHKHLIRQALKIDGITLENIFSLISEEPHWMAWLKKSSLPTDQKVATLTVADLDRAIHSNQSGTARKCSSVFN